MWKSSYFTFLTLVKKEKIFFHYFKNREMVLDFLEHFRILKNFPYMNKIRFSSKGFYAKLHTFLHKAKQIFFRAIFSYTKDFPNHLSIPCEENKILNYSVKYFSFIFYSYCE